MSVLVIVFGAALGAVAYVTSTERVTVVAAARDIPAGHVLGRDDLRGVDVAAPGVTTVPASEAGSLLGQTTVGPIPAGALIAPGMATGDLLPGPGEAGVGIALKPGQMPAELTAGRTVTVLSVPAQATAEDASPTEQLVPEARVASVEADPSGAWLVTVAVPERVAPQVAAAAATGSAALVLLPAGR